MSSVIYIKGSKTVGSPSYFDGEETKKFSLVDSEITINYETEFGSFNDLVPSIGDVVEKLTSFTTAFGGATSSGMLDLKNLFSVQRWQNTKPPRVNVKLHFYVKTNPMKDIGVEMRDLINLYILTTNKNDKNTFDVPGISLRTMKAGMQSSQKESDVLSTGKFCSIKIPGMIFLPIAMVTQAQPTYSAERTQSGYPLWGVLDIEFTGLYPATEKNYDNFPGANSIQTAEENIKKPPISIPSAFA